MGQEFVQLRQVFGLHRFKLHRHLVDGTVKSVWFRKVFGFLRVWLINQLRYTQFLQFYLNAKIITDESAVL
jgi:hypothetical protein